LSKDIAVYRGTGLGSIEPKHDVRAKDVSMKELLEVTDGLATEQV